MSNQYYKENLENISKSFPKLSPILVGSIMPSTYKAMIDSENPFPANGDDEAFRLWFNVVFGLGANQEEDSE